jgi:hypothetical protein
MADDEAFFQEMLTGEPEKKKSGGRHLNFRATQSLQLKGADTATVQCSQ